LSSLTRRSARNRASRLESRSFGRPRESRSRRRCPATANCSDGRASGAVVCAEGIETLGDLERLADLDVGFGQGYVIARPGPEWPL